MLPRSASQEVRQPPWGRLAGRPYISFQMVLSTCCLGGKRKDELAEIKIKHLIKNVHKGKLYRELKLEDIEKQLISENRYYYKQQVETKTPMLKDTQLY